MQFGSPHACAPAAKPGGRYYRPGSLAEAVELLAADPWTVVAGCTVYYLNPGNRPETDWILDISGLTEIGGIAVDTGGVRIGAAVTWSSIAKALLPPACRALQDAANSVGSVQIRNTGTLGGNLAGAASTADGVPPLLVLDAMIELRAATGTRTVPIADFILGNRRTAKRPDELVSAVLVPLPAAARCASTYLKFAARSSQGPAIVTVAARLGLDAAGSIDQAAVAVGACSPTPQRLVSLQRRLIGVEPTTQPLAALLDPEVDLAVLSPTSDVRVTAAYRLDAAATLIRRVLTRLAAEIP
ncbi:MAG: FAD binding domain-containing protein [Rhodospirillales bacterium]